MEDGRHTSSPTDDVPISRSSPSTNRPSSSPTPPTTNDLSPSSSSEGYGAASSEPPAAAPSGSTPHASQFASMTHSKEWGRDDDPASIVEEQQGTVAIRPTAESFRPATVEDDAVDGPDVDPSSYAPRPVVGGDMTDWANTALDHPPPAASLTYEPSSYNEFRRGIPRAFVEQCQSCGWRRSWRECICRDVLSVDDLMMRGSQCGGWSTHLLPHGRRSDLEILPIH